METRDSEYRGQAACNRQKHFANDLCPLHVLYLGMRDKCPGHFLRYIPAAACRAACGADEAVQGKLKWKLL